MGCQKWSPELPQKAPSSAQEVPKAPQRGLWKIIKNQAFLLEICTLSLLTVIFLAFLLFSSHWTFCLSHHILHGYYFTFRRCELRELQIWCHLGAFLTHIFGLKGLFWEQSGEPFGCFLAISILMPLLSTSTCTKPLKICIWGYGKSG